MDNVINIIQIILSIILVAGILFQQRGSGLAPVFGGSGGAYRTRRGLEKIIFWGTIIISALFFITAIISVLIRR